MFKWMVPKGGYRWVRIASGASHGFDEGWVLEPKCYEFEEYDPFENPALFRRFAAIEPTRAAILSFANEYGHLGDDAKFPEDFLPPRELAPDEDADELEIVSEAERRRATWDWLREQRFYYSLPEPEFRWIKRVERMRWCVEVWEGWEGRQPKNDDVEQLMDKINGQLVFDVELVLSRPRNTPTAIKLEVVPRHLLGALWVQLAQAVSENKSLRKCPGCDRWFEWSPQQYRKSRRYCDDSCRSQAYRNRKRRAAQMHKLGSNTADIAAALGAKRSTVEKWLAK